MRDHRDRTEATSSRGAASAVPKGEHSEVVGKVVWKHRYFANKNKWMCFNHGMNFKEHDETMLNSCLLDPMKPRCCIFFLRVRWNLESCRFFFSHGRLINVEAPIDRSDELERAFGWFDWINVVFSLSCSIFHIFLETRIQPQELTFENNPMAFLAQV